MSVIEMFQFNDRHVRVVIVAGEPWFVLADLCRVLGLGNAAMVARRLYEEEKGVSQIDTPGGRQSVTVVNEPGMYQVVLRSDKPEAAAFRRWITSEVLPQIRKTGGYGRPQIDPTSIEGALQLVQAAQTALTALAQAEEKIAEDAPKVLFADAVAASEDSILVSRLAGLLKQNGADIGEIRLFQKLREDGFLCRSKGADWNRPTQRALDLGLFEVVERTIQDSDGAPRLKFTPKVTGKGQQYFIKKYAPVDSLVLFPVGVSA